ncbi:MAG TPA: 23S rRNA (adenine(2503)-C(2))-methyltransferase RlmN, partial [Mesotoga sp.]|nr:23S rRNA (adenine(2503)-C(2))-methyltransferase RlmN [Mesotoga sp.]
MIDLLSTGLNQLRDLMGRLGEGSFRANQIFDWVYRKKITDFDSMTNLSKALRAKLREELYFPLMEVVNKQVSSDG